MPWLGFTGKGCDYVKTKYSKWTLGDTSEWFEHNNTSVYGFLQEHEVNKAVWRNQTSL